MIKESQSRIWTMALIHQTLYQSGNLADIDMADYIRSLVGNLLSSQAQVAMPPTIRFDLLAAAAGHRQGHPPGPDHQRAGDQRHEARLPGRAAGRDPHLVAGTPGTSEPRPQRGDRIRLRRTALAYELIVADNGVGLPAGFDLKNQKSLGLQLVAMLTQQLGGTLARRQRSGSGVSHLLRRP